MTKREIAYWLLVGWWREWLPAVFAEQRAWRRFKRHLRMQILK
jgi:hypothetical protein